ncbi:MAG TPA: hypothetical protein VGN63_14255 [Flavisolibacter sp.]|jgi:hypothetical protein|nr:hypothetical protein [Flavisolibacter sp.]
MGRIAAVFFLAMLLNVGKAAAQLHLQPVRDSLLKPVFIRVLPQNFYNKELSFFCQKELQLQKLTSLPVFIRLGAKDYVDFLEKKPNAVWRR